MTGSRRYQPDLDAVRAFHRKFVTGVTIVTAMDGGAPRGLAVNAFSSISLSPALILVCVARTAATHDPLYRAERFAVNALAHDQAGLARQFGSRSRDKFDGIPGGPAPTAAPCSTVSAAGAWHQQVPCPGGVIVVRRGG